MEAVVLAGGLGTRLREKVNNIPKVLAPAAGRPFLFYVLDYLYANGVTKAVLAVSYLGEQIQKTVGGVYKGMIIDYSFEKTPLGTGGAVREALKQCGEDYVFVLNGDTVFDADLREMYKKREKGKAVLAVKYLENTSRYGTVVLSDEKIVSFKEKREKGKGYINGGVYLVDKNISGAFPGKENFSLENDFFQKNTDILKNFVSDGYFIDMGIPEDYETAEKTIKNAVSPKMGKAVFLDRDGTINENTGHLFKKEDFLFLETVPDAIREFRKRGYYVVVITNQAGVAKGLYTEKDIEILNGYIQTELLKTGAYIDLFLHCPHHPEGIVEEYRKNCLCRKPGTGMIQKTLEYFKDNGVILDLKNSVLAGDMESDLETGKNAGIGFCAGVGNKKIENSSYADLYIDKLYDIFNYIK